MPDHKTKTALTGEEKITVAFMYLVRGIPQHDLATMYGVNPGRIAEAIIPIREAAGLQKGPRNET